MFIDYSPTQYDLNFRIFGFHVRVHPLFWLVSALLNWHSSDRASPAEKGFLMLVGVACFFVSILVHELGHAFLMRYAGFNPEVVLYGFGGLAIPNSTRRASPGMHIIISFAGPAAGFILFGVVFGIEQLLLNSRFPMPLWLRYAFAISEYVNLWWGLVNLLPIYPLDGGQISRTWMQSRWGLQGLMQSLVISIIVSAIVALWFYRQSGYNLLSMGVVMFVLFCAQNVQEYQLRTSGHRW